MNNSLFWLGLSLFLVAFSLTTVLIVTLPAMLALARAARSIEKLADILARELPSTLEAIRLTGIEISELTDDINDSVQTAGEIVKQVDQKISHVRKQTKQVKTTTNSIFTGIKVAWKTFSCQQQGKKNTRKQLKHLSPYSDKNNSQNNFLSKDIIPISETKDSNLNSESSTKQKTDRK